MVMMLLQLLISKIAARAVVLLSLVMPKVQALNLKRGLRLLMSKGRIFACLL